MEIYAPFAGIVHYKVAVGDTVVAGQELASVEAVKLEVAVVAPGPGVVDSVAKSEFSDVVGGELLLVVRKG
ncbi:biotin/lipoyl-containing protein [Corynebacterium sp. HS2168-gen11]|uniref:biotin/lipoyl-containing protein n=1 Tax=Corynebacterium sp. HS2168-gen11 TaxID=2974027 RepID=UPI00216AD3E8|nr:biotin/lipoyl-containing protein [Corynebacterium sp. HS2168-gen11]MCS4534796.1 acetyl-CoA carboxylase biotin carboxyl carrier protein subunit [Corynebacterium sp. HS2168-gen11]